MIEEIYKPKEPPRIAVKFANMVFMLGILYSILLIVFSIYKIYDPLGSTSHVFYITSMLSGGVLAALFSLILKSVNNNLKVNLSLLLFTIGITIYGFETYLVLQREIIAKQIAKEIAKQDVKLDWRTKMEVVDDLRNSGIDAFPNFYPNLLLKSEGLTSKKDKIYPLGTISNSTTILSNEEGFWPVVETDEYGFNNSKGIYIENEVDIILTGDSFTEGIAVHYNQNIGAILREMNYNAISIGKGGNGPLLELAALIEYAKPLKPKIVVWLYVGNDFDNLESEMKSSFLRKYLEKNYSQNLIFRQKEIDEVLKNYILNKLKIEKQREPLTLVSSGKKTIINPLKLNEKNKVENAKKTIINPLKLNEKNKVENAKKTIINLLKLTELRSRITNVILVAETSPSPTTTTSSSHTPFYFYTLTSTSKSTTIPTFGNIFREILEQSKQMVSEWGGQMYFSSLPFSPNSNKGKKPPNIDFVMQVVNELNIPIIDIHGAVLKHPDPLSFFPFRKHGHYNAVGNRFVAEEINKRLEKDGYNRIKRK